MNTNKRSPRTRISHRTTREIFDLAYIGTYIAMKNPKPKAREAIEMIRGCVTEGRYEVTQHFAKRLKQRNMVWADVLALLDEPTEVRSDGPDKWGRPHWVVAGKAADGLPIELACAIQTDEQGHVAVLITIYWPDR